LTAIDETAILPAPRSEDDVRQELARYYAHITDLDEQVGRVIQALEHAGQLDRTIVIYTSDHGLAFGSHGLMGKTNMYEHTIGIPLIVSGPGIPAGERRTAQCYLRDLFATICQWASVGLPEAVDARSLTPALDDKNCTLRQYVFGYWASTQRMIRSDRWKLICYPQVGREQLFDLAADPDELHDLASAAEHQSTIDELRAELRRWQQSVGDTVSLHQ